MAETLSADSSCSGCKGISEPLTATEAQARMGLVPLWKMDEGCARIERQFRARNFTSALTFFDAIGELAEAEGHHPDLHLTRWNKVSVVLWTHTLKGLTDNDFIMALKIDTLPEP